MSELLTTNWLTAQPIDHEYKQYMLLAYKQNQSKKLKNNFLYPTMNDVLVNKNYTDTFIKNITDIENSKVSTIGINWIEMKLVYKSLVNDDLLDDIKKTAFFGKTIFDELYQKCYELHNNIEESINIEGQIISMFTFTNGYIEFKHGSNIIYYEYNLKKLIGPEPKNVLELEIIKEKIYYQNRFLKNYFNVTINNDYPFENALMPVFKQKFLNNLVKNI